METFYTSGKIVDIVLVFVAVEFAALAVIYTRTGRGIAPRDVASNLLSAVFLLLALRSALNGMSWLWTAAFLAASFPAHLLDLRIRWNNPPGPRRPETETDVAPGRGDR